MVIFFVLLLSGTFISGMNPPAKAEQELSQNKATSSVYSDQDRDSIIEMTRTLKYCHLLFPIGNSIFKRSIMHALIDGDELLEEINLASLDLIVHLALVNLARTIKQTCPQRDFLASVETLLEQIDDRYEEEAAALFKEGHNNELPEWLSSEKEGKKIGEQLAYAVAHYEQLTPKNLKYMVEGHKSAPEILQKHLASIPAQTISTWHAETFKK